MKVGLIGTGAIANKHADCYRELGYELVAVSNRGVEKGRQFAEKHGAEFHADFRELCRRGDIDYVDVCAFPDSRLEMTREAASHGKHVLVQKPVALTLDDAAEMIRLTRERGVLLGVVSQFRFSKASLFLRRAIEDGRLGRLLEADCYVKWHRPQSYYDRPGKGAWTVEGGGALINQGIHGADLLRHFAGPAREISAQWQLGAAHKMDSEDVVNALVRFASGATGVIQAATAFWPGYPERIELHGTKGSAIVISDRLAHWDVEGDDGAGVPLDADLGSGASDPMAISLEPLKRQFRDFGEAIEQGRKPAVDGQEGYESLRLVLSVYESARNSAKVTLD